MTIGNRKDSHKYDKMFLHDSWKSLEFDGINLLLIPIFILIKPLPQGLMSCQILPQHDQDKTQYTPSQKRRKEMRISTGIKFFAFSALSFSTGGRD